MLRNSKLLFLLALAILISSCESDPEKEWIQTVPQKVPFLVLPEGDDTFESILESEHAPFLDDITGSAISLISQVDSTDSSGEITVKGIMMYPGAENQLQPIWVSNAPEEYDKKIANLFYEQFSQNQYNFNDVTIHNLHVQDRNIFAAQLKETLYLSESSQGIEDVIRTYKNISPSADISQLDLTDSSIILNTPSLDRWVEQMGQVIYRPVIQEAFSGTQPVALQTSTDETENYNARKFIGTMGLEDESSRSTLIAALSHSNSPIELDNYISSNAAAFGIFRLPPKMAPPSSPDTSSTTLDSLFIEEETPYQNIAESLDDPFALVMYSESGFLTTGEHLFLRKLSDPDNFEEQLREFEDEELLERQDGIYFIQSGLLAKLIGSEINTFANFYLDITGDVAVISKRRGLAEIVDSDRNRRRVISYEQDYAEIKETMPEEVSSLVMANNDFSSFIDPFLAPENYVDVLLSQFDLLTLHTELNEPGDELTMNLTSYDTEQKDQPYQENWMFPLDDTELTGQPVLGDIGGSSRDEIIFATEDGTVYALASDGTDVFEESTGDDTPVGSPQVYDWYGTGQNVILQAAGDKIYGWNDTGEELPNFPFELSDDITSPIHIHDLNRDGLPNILVGTADRDFHVLDGRGDAISGWPKSTNAPVTTQPLVDTFRDELSVITFSENAIHAWNADGELRDDFPKFLEAGLSGSPILHNGNILAGAADGYLYSVGENTLFADSLNAISNTTDTSGVEGVYIANSSLVGTPSIHQNVTVESDDETYNEPLILTMSSNGSVFFINEDGVLRFTESMGQPSSDTFSPTVTDIDSNDEQEVVALADFGRLYAWQIVDGERLLSLPTTAIKYPIITNINGDDYQELIAQTNNGIRSWSIYPTPDDDEDEEEDEDDDEEEEEDEEDESDN